MKNIHLESIQNKNIVLGHNKKKNIVIQNQMMNLLGQVMILDLDQKKNQKKKEFINKEAPEGLEVIEFDGLNINEEMG